MYSISLFYMKLILLIAVGSEANLEITVFDESVSITYPEAFSANIRFRKDHNGEAFRLSSQNRDSNPPLKGHNVVQTSSILLNRHRMSIPIKPLSVDFFTVLSSHNPIKRGGNILATRQRSYIISVVPVQDIVDVNFLC
jgi:hypothetical protein